MEKILNRIFESPIFASYAPTVETGNQAFILSFYISVTMQIVITGTPGTGKTSVAQVLDKKGWNVVDIKEFIKKQDIGSVKGEEIEVRIGKLEERLEEEFHGLEEDLVIEGHLAHHYPADYCIVLRCDPEILEGRISKRGYNRRKIEENVEAESLDIILQEAVQKQEKIIEIDTTDREAEDVAEEIEKRVENDETGYGEVDWSEFL